MEYMFEEVVNEEIEGEIGEPAALYEQCRFIRCDFTGIDLSKVTFVDCSFELCNLSSIKVGGTVMNECRFIESKLIGINFADMAQETLALCFKQCRIDSSIFDNVQLPGINFGESELLRCEFLWSDFSGADFSSCNLKGTRFSNCNIEKSDFRGTDNLMIDLQDNRVKGASFSISAAPELLLPFGIHLD